MSIHQIDAATFLVEYHGLRGRAGDVGALAAAQGVPDRAFGAELRRLLYAAMESTPEAQWVRERPMAVQIAPTEPHRGRLVYRMTFQDEDAAMAFSSAWAGVRAGDHCPSRLRSEAA